MRQILSLLFLLGGFAVDSAASECGKKLDPWNLSRFVPNKKRYTDGRGNLVPPIGSKIFIAWRNRTPLHIPDSAFFNVFLEEEDIQKMGSEGALFSELPVKSYETKQGYQLPKGTRSFEEELRSVFAKAKDASIRIQDRAVKFRDDEGSFLWVLLDSKMSHAIVGRKILEDNPTLSFLDAGDISLELVFEGQNLLELSLLPRHYFSQYMPKDVLGRSVSEELRQKLSQEKYLTSLLKELFPERLSPSFRVRDLSRDLSEVPKGPTVFEAIPHMLK